MAAVSTSVLVTSPSVGVTGITVGTGEERSGSVMVGVPENGVTTRFYANWCDATGYDANDANSLYIATNGQLCYAVIHPGEWKTLYLKPLSVAAVDANVIGIYVYGQVDKATYTMDYLIDCVQIGADGQQSSTWQVGGTPRAASTYDLNWQTPEKGTHVFSFCPFAQSSWYDAIGGDWYIRSWRVSSTVHAQLYYDSDDQKFKLDVDDGVNTDALETAAQAFKKGQPLIFIVQFGDDDDTNVHLSVGHGRTIETVNGAAEDYSAFGLSNVLVRWGDKDAASGMNGTVVDKLFTGLLAPADLVSQASP
jgi:hypothetical protein